VRRVYLSLALLSQFLIFGFAPQALAQSQKTDIRPHANRVLGNDLKSSFIGQTHSGAYNFTKKGEPTHFYQERHNKDGSVSYSEGEGVPRDVKQPCHDNDRETHHYHDWMPAHTNRVVSANCA